MVAGSEENKRQNFTVNSISGSGVDNNQVQVQNLVSRNLRSHVGVVEMGTGIRNGLETYQYKFVGIMGHNMTHI